MDCFQKTKLAFNLLVRARTAPSRRADVGNGAPLARGATSPHIRVPAPLTTRVPAPLRPTRVSAPLPPAKLQKHIENPSAAELVHFLFGPLDLVPGAGGSGDLGACW